jgi:hypothetical protein
MYQKDYILRMVEMLADLIAMILGLIKKGDVAQAADMLERIYYDMLKQDAIFFRNIPESKLTSTLIEEHNFTNGHIEILAELFNVEAELETAKGDMLASVEYSRKSLLLFEFIDRDLKTYSQVRTDKMNALRNRIDKLEADFCS